MKGYTIQHSINLLEDSVEDLESRPADVPTAEDVSYDNTASHMTADDVQEAIDELNTGIGDLNTAISQITTDIEYSTTKKKIGTWVDGKDVYLQAFLVESQVAYATSWTDTNIDFTDVVAILSADIIDITDNLLCTTNAAVDGTSKHLKVWINRGTSLTVPANHYIVVVFVEDAPETNTRKRSKK